MLLKPQNREELSRRLAEASHAGTKISRVDLSSLQSLVEHQPEDMTATVEAGMTLLTLQEALARHRQWLPIDPCGAGSLGLGNLLAADLSGPRRLGHGTIRDHLIGIKVALANGEIIKAGGKVVKNVAGYDLCKLFVGARHSLGVIVEATFKLKPLPEAELILESSFDHLDSLAAAARAVLASPAEPVLLDAHNLKGVLTLMVGLAGAREDVEYQAQIVWPIAKWTESDTSYDQRLPTKISVLPSATCRTLSTLGGARFVARLGNGVIYHDGSAPSSRPVPNPQLLNRVKQTYDPRGILPTYAA